MLKTRLRHCKPKNNGISIQWLISILEIHDNPRPPHVMKLSSSRDPTHDVIASIVSLTEQRDQRSLEQSLVTTLEEMLDDAEGWLLDV